MIDYSKFRNIIVEIGSHQGVNTHNYISDNMDGFVFAFEPTYDLFLNHLLPKFKKYKNVLLMPMAVDIETGYKLFNVANDSGCSSIHTFTENIENIWKDRNHNDFKVKEQYLVPTITMYDFCNLYKLDRIDYLHIDTQGNDFNILLSLKDKIKIVKAGKCEVFCNTQLYKNTNNFYTDVRNWLIHQGFKVQEGAEIPNLHETDLHFQRC